MDFAISSYFSQLLGQYPFFDLLILRLSDSYLAKGAALSALLWMLWFWQSNDTDTDTNEDQNRPRAIVLATLIASVFAEVFARFLSNFTPFKLRPFLESDLAMKVPEGLRALAPEMMTESSFPSDHAILFFAMATGIFLVSRRIGIFAFIYRPPRTIGIFGRF